MPHDETKAKRGPDGKFLPGHRPPKSPGRPPGPNGVKARASRLAGERLEQMLGRAAEVIETELESGNLQVAQWIIDRIRPPGRSDFVRLGSEFKFGTIEEILHVSERAAVAASRGEISLQHAKLVQDIIGRHAEITALEELARLRRDIETLRSSTGGYTKADKSGWPKWGRLNEVDQ